MSRTHIKHLVLFAALGPLGACAKKAPETAPVPAPDPQAWRATMPAGGVEAAWAPPVAAQFTLSNGIPVYLVENPGLPLVTIQVSMAVGRDANPKGKAGLTALTASMLDEGTKKRPGAVLAADLADLGAELAVWGGGDDSVVVLDALGGEALAPSLDLLAEVLLQPRFDKADFARVKQQTLDQITADRSDPRQVARRVFSTALFGADHPYGAPVVGDETTVGKLTLDDAKKLYSSQWHAGNARLVVTGATTQAELQPLLEARLGGWAKGKGARVELAAPPVPAATQLVFVEQPGAVQSMIFVGTPAMPRTSDEFVAANMAGTLVGGMFGSRLNMNLREEKGWSYGAYGGFSEDRAVGVFAARASVQADKTAPAVTEMLKELGAARREPTADEMKLTRDYLVKSLPGMFETNHATANAFASALAVGLGADAWKELPGQIDAVTPAAVASMAGKYFDPARQLVVVVGPRTVEVEEAGAKKTVDVVAELTALGFATREIAR